MVNGFSVYNLGLVAGILTLLWIQISLFLKSNRPVYQEPSGWGSIFTRRPREPWEGGPVESEKSSQLRRIEAKARYNREWTIYTLTYVLPIIFTILAIFSILNFSIGLIFFIIAFVLTLIEVIAIKYFDIGVI